MRSRYMVGSVVWYTGGAGHVWLFCMTRGSMLGTLLIRPQSFHPHLGHWPAFKNQCFRLLPEQTGVVDIVAGRITPAP